MSWSPEGWEEDCRCPLCGTACYPPWLTDDETWERVMGDSNQQICIGCFFDKTDLETAPDSVIYVSLAK